MIGKKSKFVELEKTEQSYAWMRDSKQVQIFEKGKVIVETKKRKMVY